MATRSRRITIIVVAGVAALALALVAIPQLRWRVHIVALHLAGEITDISLQEIVAYMMPGSDQVM
jgi:hypothetical protein